MLRFINKFTFEVANKHVPLKRKLLEEIMPYLLIKNSVRLFIQEVD